MRTIYPSTTSLRVFEAAARHLNFTGAADELFLTQSAVSKQIRALEETLGVSLFVRVNRGLVLTDLGRSYADEIRPLLAQLAQASGRIAEAAKRTGPATLTLRILAIIGDRWLLPRFDSFSREHPNIEVQFTSLLSRDGSEQKPADGEFRYGEGSWPGSVSDYLFGREMLLVAAPALLARQALNGAADVPGFALFHHFQAPDAWDEFFDAHGLGQRAGLRSIRYEFYSTLIKAAVAGMGLGLVPAVWVQDELARGELVNPLALGSTSRHGYFFVMSEAKQASPALALFRDWLRYEAELTLTQLAGPAR